MSGQGNDLLTPVLNAVLERGDLAHLALFLWAVAATALLVIALRDLAAANRRFDLFVKELARFNRLHS